MDPVNNILLEATLEARARVLMLQDTVMCYELTSDMTKAIVRRHQHMVDQAVYLLSQQHPHDVNFKAGEEYDCGGTMPPEAVRRAFRLLTGRTVKVLSTGEDFNVRYVIRLWEIPEERRVRLMKDTSAKILEQVGIIEDLQARVLSLADREDLVECSAGMQTDETGKRAFHLVKKYVCADQGADSKAEAEVEVDADMGADADTASLIQEKKRVIENQKRNLQNLQAQLALLQKDPPNYDDSH